MVYIASSDWMGCAAAKCLDAMSADPAWWRLVVPTDQVQAYSAVWPGQVLDGGPSRRLCALRRSSVELSKAAGEPRRWLLDDRCKAFMLTDQGASRRREVGDWADLWPMMDAVEAYGEATGLPIVGLSVASAATAPANRSKPCVPSGALSVGDVRWPSCSGDEACAIAECGMPAVGFRHLSVRLGKRPVGDPLDTKTSQASNLLMRDPMGCGLPKAVARCL